MTTTTLETPVPDPFEDSGGAIAERALGPLLATIGEALLTQGVAPEALHDIFVSVAEVYAAGHRDGVRYAVAEIAPEAERHGLRLWLAPELEEPAPEP